MQDVRSHSSEAEDCNRTRWYAVSTGKYLNQSSIPEDLYIQHRNV